jgi:hypothetical protein
MDLLQNNPRSPYNSEDDENQVDSDTQDKSPGWVRGCWFPPSSKEETVYNLLGYPNYSWDDSYTIDIY